MTSVPQAGSRQKASLFSKAWGVFAQVQKTAPPSTAVTADASTEKVERETRSVDVSTRQEPAGDLKKGAVEQTSDVGRKISAAVGAPVASSAQLKPGFAEVCFSGLAHVAFLALPLFLLAQFAVGFYALTPWLLPQEARFAESYEFMVASGQWLMGPAASLPVWFWTLRLLDALPYVDGPMVFTAGAALAGTLTLLATWFLALSAGYSRRAAFASGLVLLSCLAFPALAHRVGPELLFTGLLTLGLACLLRGWNKDSSSLWLPLGCVFVALAGLTNGIFGLVLPVLGSLIFLAWKGAFVRFNKADGVAAFVILLALPLAWLGAVILFGPGEAQLRELCTRLIDPFLPPYWPPKNPAWFYTAVLPLALAPWMLVPFFVSWGSALAHPLGQLLSTRRENSGSAWVWIHLAAGLLLLSAMSSKFCLDVLPLLPLLAIVLGKTIVNLPQTNSRAFFFVLAALFGLVALALGLASLAQFWPLLQDLVPLAYPKGFAAIKGLPILAGICLLTAFVLWKLIDRRFPGASLLVCAMAVTVLCLPALMLTSPSMQDIFLGNTAVSKDSPAIPDGKPHVQAPDAAAPEENITPAPGPREETETPDAAPTKTPEDPAPAQGHAEPAAPQPEREPVQNP